MKIKNPKIKNILTRTYPAVFHMNGKILSDEDREKMMNLIYYLIEFKKPKYNSKELTIITYNNLPEDKGLFEKTLDKLGFDYFVLGKNINPWKNIFKLKLILEKIEEIKTKYVLACDDRDVILFDSPDKIVSHFKGIDGCEMLFMAEVNDYPERSDTREFEESVALKKNPFKFLNSGVFISNTDFLKKIVREALELNDLWEKEKGKKNYSDQMIYKILYKKYYPQIRLDHKCKVFQSIINSKTPHEFSAPCTDYLKIENVGGKKVIFIGDEITKGSLMFELASNKNSLASTQSELEHTKKSLSMTQSELSSAKDSLSSTQRELTSTKNLLTSTQSNLESTKKSLNITQSELSSAKGSLSVIKNSLNLIQHELTSTKDLLTSTQSNLESTKKSLNITQSELSSTKNSFDSIRNSMSWKITFPLRYVHSKIVSFKKSFLVKNK